jgi:hypothetical protein
MGMECCPFSRSQRSLETLQMNHESLNRPANRHDSVTPELLQLLNSFPSIPSDIGREPGVDPGGIV